MTKFLLVAAVSIVGLGLTASDAQAGRRCCRCQQSCCTPAPTCCGATAPAPAAAPYAAPAPPQANAGGYQSFSYEPGGADMSPSTSLVATSGNVNQRASSFYESVRGDKKVRAFER